MLPPCDLQQILLHGQCCVNMHLANRTLISSFFFFTLTSILQLRNRFYTSAEMKALFPNIPISARLNCFNQRNYYVNQELYCLAGIDHYHSRHSLKSNCPESSENHGSVYPTNSIKEDLINIWCKPILEKRIH